MYEPFGAFGTRIVPWGPSLRTRYSFLRLVGVRTHMRLQSVLLCHPSITARRLYLSVLKIVVADEPAPGWTDLARC